MTPKPFGARTFLVLLVLVSALVIGATGQANVTGQWSTASYTMPINPVHVAVLHNGKLLVVAGSGNCPPTLSGCPSGAPYGTSNGSGALVLDPASGSISRYSLSWDMFCNGMVVLPDGRAFIDGGTVQYDPFYGSKMSAIFDPSTNTFTNVQNMAHGRWYPTSVTLGDGRVMTFAGLDENNNTNSAVEIYTVGTGWSTQYIASWTPPLYPRLHLLPSGKVFYDGSTATSALFDPSTNSWTTNVATTNYGGTRTYGSSVLLPLTPANNYDPKVMILGGNNPATNTTELIDMGASSPHWVTGVAMSQARIEMNAVMLPNGKVLALGGSVNDEDPGSLSLNADLYDLSTVNLTATPPNVGTRSSAGANATERLYHSVAVLLPDATVWLAGGNPTRGTYNNTVEIYKPPYLFNSSGGAATRPTITSAPAAIFYGNAFTVQTPDAANISSAVLMRPAAVTHAFDMDQRLVGVSFTAGSGSLTITAPPNGNIAPPGYYMLFLLNSSGVPSLAQMVQLSASTQGTGSLVAAYSFNEGSGTTVGDSSGLGNTGTVANATWTTAGKFGNALVFNGTNAVVTIPDAASLHLTGGMTIEAWVNPSVVSSGWRDVIYKGNDNFYIEGTSGNGPLPAGGATWGSAHATIYATTGLTANTWVHLALTYDGANLRLYVNGTQVASLAQTGNLTTSTNPLQIGGDSIYGQYFQGAIDEIRVYNGPLTAAQIQSDMATPIGGGGDTQAPTAPSSLTATAVSSSQINLSWTASTDNVGVTQYLVERCAGSGCTSFAQVGTSPGTTYNDTGLASAASYTYRVRATDAAGNLSGYSNVYSATTQAGGDTQAPTAPSSLTATAVSSSQINLSWTASTDNVGVTQYLVERCAGSGCTSFAQVGTSPGTTYNDTGLASAASYTYRVRATDAAGNLSGYSNVYSATTQGTTSGGSLVAAYSFNEGSGTTVGDSSGLGNTGTVANATWTTAGKFGNALVFNGTNAVVTIPDAASLHLTGGMTIEAWVNPSVVSSGWRDVIYKGNDNFYIEGTSGNGPLPAGGATWGSAHATIYATTGLTANTWVHLALTYDGANLRLYVNGTQVASLAQTGNLTTSTNPLQIGGDSIYGQYFQGAIDEIRVYNGPLTAAQIQSDMATPIGGGGDTQAPTAPSSLTATAVSSSQINLSWTASTDNVGVTQYLVERCAGSGCTSFAQVGTSPGTTYNDTGLASAASYTYRVRATDAAGNLSGYSNVYSATTQGTTSGGSLVAAYSFNEGSGTTVGDSSGLGNTGTVANATWTTAGKFGNALVFNGTNAVVTIPDAASLHLTGGMTIEAWVNPSVVSSGWRDVIYKGNDNFYIEGTSGNGPLPAGGATWGSAHATIYATTGLTANTWVHLALTYDGANLRLYVNGTQVASLAQTGNLTTSTNPLQIGGDSIYGQYFQGAIDEIRVYNGPLTAAQIQSDMTTPVQ